MGSTFNRTLIMGFVILVACTVWLTIAAQAEEAVMENTFAGNAEAISEGEELFDEYCSECHGDGTGGTGPNLIDSEWIYGSSDAEVYRSVASGRPEGMPSMKYDMEKEEIWKTISYIRSLSK